MMQMAIVLLISQIIALKQLHQAVLQVLLQLAHALKAILLQVSVLLLAQLKHPLQLAPPAFALVFSKPLEANATNCSWAGNTCSLLTTLTDCATVAPASCATNTQCKSVTVYNCSSTQASINAFCGTNPAGTVCGATLTGWCTSTTTNTCAINNAYCVLGTTC